MHACSQSWTLKLCIRVFVSGVVHPEPAAQNCAELAARERAPEEHRPLQPHDGHAYESPVSLADLMAALKDLPDTGAEQSRSHTQIKRLSQWPHPYIQGGHE